MAKLATSAELVTGLVLLVGVSGVFIAQIGPTLELASSGRQPTRQHHVDRDRRSSSRLSR